MGLDLIRAGGFGWANRFGLTLSLLYEEKLYKLVQTQDPRLYLLDKLIDVT